jgi:hypothetical protein
MPSAASRLVRWSVASLWVGALAGFVESLGCQSSPPASNAREVGARPSSPFTKAGAAPPSASAESLPSEPPSSSPSEDPEPDGSPERLPREIAEGSTKGTIACGAKRCAAGTEVCAVVDPDLAWACLPVAQREQAKHDFYECDDGSDCTGGKACCQSFASANESYVCTARGQGCRMEVCVEGDGSSCPKKQHCEDGRCVADSTDRATCAGRRQCDAAKPICKWDGAGECMDLTSAGKLVRALDDPDVDFSIHACTLNSDCGVGFRCCTGMRGPKLTFCSQTCDVLNGYQLCRTTADCPKLEGVKFTCKDPGDVGVSLPPWSRVCVM